MDIWTSEQVTAVAPDSASLTAGRKLAVAAKWAQTGADAARGVVWGACQGSGKNPYQAAIDVSGPAYKCSCPSRKIPCKHVLALLMLWSAGEISPTPVSGFAAEWMDGRAQRAAKAEEKASAARTPENAAATQAAAAKRIKARRTKVDAGLDDLDRWLQDQIRTGLMGIEGNAYAVFDTIAARMVDAQAPSVASWLRSLPSVTSSGEGWHERLLSELALLRLLVVAHRRLDELPPAMSATVRAKVGYPITTEEVLTQPAVRDEWLVADLRDTVTDKLTVRVVTLVGATTTRTAQVLSFAAKSAAPDASLLPGMVLDADLHYYPGAVEIRAVVGVIHSKDTGGGELTDQALATILGGPANDVASAVNGFADAVGQDPWTTSLPILLGDVAPVRTPQGWRVVDAAGPPGEPATALPWKGRDHSGIRALAITGGAPSRILVELSPQGAQALAVITSEGVQTL